MFLLISFCNVYDMMISSCHKHVNKYTDDITNYHNFSYRQLMKMIIFIKFIINLCS